jgi:hypothetical protein
MLCPIWAGSWTEEEGGEVIGTGPDGTRAARDDGMVDLLVQARDDVLFAQ